MKITILTKDDIFVYFIDKKGHQSKMYIEDFNKYWRVKNECNN